MNAPIIVHRLSRTGGRRVTVHGEILGLAHNDEELLDLLRDAGLPDAVAMLDDPAWVEWRGGRAYLWHAA